MFEDALQQSPRTRATTIDRPTTGQVAVLAAGDRRRQERKSADAVAPRDASDSCA